MKTAVCLGATKLPMHPELQFTN